MMRRDAFFHSPDGLGASRSKSYIGAGLEFIKTEDRLDQKTVTGEMVFAGYEVYQEFTVFCAHTPLVLGYAPLQKWFYADCEVSHIGKTEIDRSSNRLLCPVDFIASGPWYESLTYSQTQTEPNIGKRYPYKYPYKYARGVIGSVKPVNTGTLDSPVYMYIYGPCTNPTWTLIVNGGFRANGRINTVVASGEVLRVFTAPSEMEAAIYDAANMTFIRDVYGDSDWATARMILVPPGECTISFSQAGAGFVRAVVGVKQLAETV